MLAVLLASLVAAGTSSAQDLVPIRTIVRKFPNGFCPFPDLGVQFTAISNKVTVEFSANTSYLGNPVALAIDDLCIADAFQVTTNLGTCSNCSSYEGDPVSMFLFDNFDPNGQVITWLERFDTDPAGRGWDMTHGAIYETTYPPNIITCNQAGSLRLVNIGPCADSLARTSITVTGLIPGQSYILTGWWSADQMAAENSEYLKIRITDQGYNLSQSAWGASAENMFRLTHEGFSRIDHVMVPDGQGGAIALWAEQRSSDYDIYAQRFLANGTIAPGWPSDGVALTTFTGDQVKPYAVPDGTGGAIVAWEDRRNGQGDPDVYAQRIRGDGTIASGWPTPASGGLLIAASLNTAQNGARMVPTSDGGALIVWSDGRSGTSIDVYAKRVTASGGLATGWTASGLAVCTAAGNEVLGTVASDGADGAFVTFQVHPGSSYDFSLQHVTGAGAIAAGWPASSTTGLAIGSTTADEVAGGAVPDGSGGVFVSWHAIPESSPRVQRRTSSGALATGWLAGGKLTCASGCDGSVSGSYLVRDGSDGVIVGYKNALSFDHRYFAQRLTGAGAVASGWPSTRATLTNSLGTKLDEVFASDGLGGAYMTWFESSNTTNAIYAQRIGGSGALPSGWTANGRPISLETGIQAMAATPADSSALLIAYTDFSSLVKAYRVDRHGQTGYPGPSFSAIADHASDQGGSVDLRWSAGDLINVTSFRTAGQYRFWRATEGSQPPVWQLLGSQAATDLCTRTFVAATPNIAVGGTATKTRYRLEAFEPSTGRSWFSYPDSAFSTDNLAPAVPTGLVGTPGGPGVALHWHRNTETDLQKYRVYKGTMAVFPTIPANLVGEPTDTSFIAPVTGTSYFRLTAVDTHGNEGPSTPPAGPFNPVDVGGVPPVVLALASPLPNPSMRGTTIGYSLPEQTPITLAVYDVSGREVRTLVRGVIPAGQHVARWDGTDSGGQRVKSSIYFVRLQALGQVFTRRVAMFQ